MTESAELPKSVALLGNGIKLIVGLAVLAIAVWLPFIGEPVAADFTRVGGLTRVETAVHASHLWTKPPRYYVATPANADPQTMLCAAKTAMAYDAPLLFTWRNGKLPPLVSTTIDSWQSDAKGYLPTPINVGEQSSGGTHCLAYKRPAAKRLAAINRRNLILSHYSAAEMYGGVVDRLIGGVPGVKVAEPLSVLPASYGLLPWALPVARRDTLAPVVVFAVARSFPVTAYPPDVAVGFAVASHLAAHTPTASPKVSLVVVPRGYLEANPQLEQQLRDQRGMVQGGVVLGSTRILPDGTQALLRQILASTDRQTLFGRVQAALGSVEPVVAALLALAGLVVAVQAARKVIPEVLEAASKGGGKVSEAIHKVWSPPPSTILADQAKAVEQIGSDKASVRVGGLCALERLAQDNPAYRQTIVNVICGYLRLPFSPRAPTRGPISEQDNGEATVSTKKATLTESGGTWWQERSVRITAQHILQEHLGKTSPGQGAQAHPAGGPFWPGIHLDLTGATLFDFRLNGAALAGALFGEAIFTGDTLFSKADLNGAELNNAKLNSADLRGADLTDAKLRGADLTNAKLSSAKLRGAKLNDAKLNDAKLNSAKLTGADLTDGKLSSAGPNGAKLSSADPNGAKLTDADLTHADPNDAKLTGADFTGAKLTGAIWPRDFPPPEGWFPDQRSRLTRVRRSGDSGERGKEVRSV